MSDGMVGLIILFGGIAAVVGLTFVVFCLWDEED